MSAVTQAAFTADTVRAAAARLAPGEWPIRPPAARAAMDAAVAAAAPQTKRIFIRPTESAPVLRQAGSKHADGAHCVPH